MTALRPSQVIDKFSDELKERTGGKASLGLAYVGEEYNKSADEYSLRWNVEVIVGKIRLSLFSVLMKTATDYYPVYLSFLGGVAPHDNAAELTGAIRQITHAPGINQVIGNLISMEYPPAIVTESLWGKPGEQMKIRMEWTNERVNQEGS